MTLKIFTGYWLGLVGVLFGQQFEQESEFWWGTGVESFVSNGDFYYLGQLGHQWEQWRLYGELGYVRSETNFLGLNLETDWIPITFNVAYDCEVAERFACFVGGGVGVSWIESEIESPLFPVDEEDLAWTGQLFAGLSFEVCDEVWFDATARYLLVGDFGIGGLSVGTAEDFSVGMGLRVRF